MYSLFQCWILFLYYCFLLFKLKHSLINQNLSNQKLIINMISIITTGCTNEKTNNCNLKLVYREKCGKLLSYIMRNKNNNREWSRRKSFDARLAAGRNIALASSLFPKTRDPLPRRGPDRRQTVRSVSWSFRFCKQIPRYEKISEDKLAKINY